MSHVHHQQQAKGDLQEMDAYSSTSHSSRPRSSGSNLIDVFSSSLNQSISWASFEPYDSSYVAHSSFSDDSYHPTEHLSVQHSGRYEDYHYGSDNCYVHNSSHTSHSENIDLTGSCDYRSAGHDTRHQNRSGSGECERGPGTDSRYHHKSGSNEHDRGMDITSPGNKGHESS